MPQKERRIHSVGFAVRDSLCGVLREYPTGLSARLMKLTLHLACNGYAIIFSCYAHTLNSSEKSKDMLQDSLDEKLDLVPVCDKIVPLGDFNARVGSQSMTWRKVLGPHGRGNLNANGHSLPTFCLQNEFSITKFNFEMNDLYMGIWRHPRFNHWHTLEYMLVLQQDCGDVCITRVIKGADCWMGHRLVRSTMKLYVRPPVKKRAASKELNCGQMRSEEKCADFFCLSSPQAGKFSTCGDVQHRGRMAKDSKSSKLIR